MNEPDKVGMAPIRASGRTYWLSHHAAERALTMGVPLNLFPAIIETGQWREPGPFSKHQGCFLVAAGKVGLGISFRGDEPVIATCLWATTEAWRDAEHKAGRKYKGDTWTRAALDSWTPIAADNVMAGATR